MNTQLSLPIHSHSLENWYDKILPTLNERQQEVLKAIRCLGRTNLNELEKYFKRSRNTFSGRISELKKKGLIKQVDRIKIGDSSYSVYELNKEF